MMNKFFFRGGHGEHSFIIIIIVSKRWHKCGMVLFLIEYIPYPNYATFLKQ